MTSPSEAAMFTITVSMEQVNVILRQLDRGEHGQVRQLIDQIISEVSVQQKSAQSAQSEEKTE